ncbi:ABC transporter substrate-binding protein [Congregibacter litoralis]|uniref:Spermidine/putrescine-binding protein periplasmic protein n=1 Tax=Congregibacter litoralis KT71 TaxID=314285 RepID=A4ABQ7_9GAMM|nr:extracellular solute-binding protein [Congregibacter litoralis]EAQ96570.2 Spermidine/putrescine-binding protein periplasmic protein [Congregibacter litoralis KT71]
MTHRKTIKLSRRQVLKRASTVLTASVIGFPAIISARNAKPTVRVLGTHVTLQEKIRQRAEQDLGINLEFSPGGSAQVLFRASMDPSSFDVYEQWSNSMRVLWQARAIQPIDPDRIERWDEINALSKTGRLSPEDSIGAGDAPHLLLYVQADGSLGPRPSSEVSYLPYVHNADSLGYNPQRVTEGQAYETESWGWLLDPQYRGRVAIVNAPSIGVFDLALAAQARGLMEFKDIGNMSREEVKQLFDILMRFKAEGHFRGFWNSVPHSAELMTRGEVDVQSMFSPGVSMVRSAGTPCIYAAPKEGYRAWQGVMCLSRDTRGEQEEAAYQYMNWWLSGWPGAFISRQGYYISNPERSRSQMPEDEWNYWYEGQPANTQLTGPDGNITVQSGERRRGGSYARRFANIAVWNTVMPTFDLTVQRWNEFVIA